MPQPFDYSLNIPNPAASVAQGVQKGIGLVQGLAQVRGAQADATAATQANERRAAFNSDLAAISGAPTAAGYASLSAKYPEFGKVLKESHDVLGVEEQKQNLSDASAVYSALSADEPEFAEELLTKQAEALRNGGREQEAKARETLAKLVKLSPETARSTAGLYLSNVMGPEKFVEGFAALEQSRRATDLEGATLTKAEAEAEKAAVSANYAESEAVLDLQKKGYDIDKIKNDIHVSRQNVRIASLNAELAKESNADRRALIQSRITDAQLKRDTTVRERVADATAGRATLDGMLNNLDKVLKAPLSVVKDATGKIGGSAIGQALEFDQPTVDFQELIETLSSQAFLTQIEKLRGTGPISNIEGEKATKAFKNLSLRQGAERFLNNVREGQEALLKMRKNITTRYGIPETVPDTPDAAPDDAETEALLNKYLYEDDSGNP